MRRRPGRALTACLGLALGGQLGWFWCGIDLLVLSGTASLVLDLVGIPRQAQSSCVCQVWLNPPQNDGTIECERTQVTRLAATRLGV